MMHKKSLSAIFLIFSMSLFSAQEKETRNLTLDEAVKLAQENNLTVKNAEITLHGKKIKNQTSWNSISPSASLSGNYSDDLDGNTSNVSLSGTVSIGLTTNLYTQIKGAELDYENGLITFEQASRQIEMQVWKDFYSLVYKKDYLELKKQNLETCRKTYENNQEKFKNGKISELDVMTSRVNYEKAKPDVEKAQTDLEDSMADFKQSLGLDQNILIELNGSLDNAVKIASINMENLPKVTKPSPSVEQAEYAVKTAENTLLSTRFSAYAPSLTGTYSYGKSKNSEKDDWNVTNSLSVGVKIPLDGWLPWSGSAVSVSSQKDALKTARNNLENEKTSQRVKTESCLRQMNQAITQIEVLKSTLELAQDTYDMTLTAYNYGKTDLMNLQSAADSVMNAGVDLKNQTKTFIDSELDLEYLLGLPFGSLNAEKTE